MSSYRCWSLRSFLTLSFAFLLLSPAWAQKVGVEEPAPTMEEKVDQLYEQAFPAVPSEPTTDSGDTAWMLMSCALVMLMVPGLALFYGGMVRGKNVLATLMQSYGMLAVIGVYWIAVGYSLAFGPSVFSISLFDVKNGGLIGWSNDLFFLKGIGQGAVLPNGTIPTYVHVIFQGMFAIITPALISGAIAERIRFWPFCIFAILWVTFIYCPLCHMVWAFDNFDTTVDMAVRGKSAIGLFGKLGALDFAGGTVVHISAGFAGLAAALILGKRSGYPTRVGHPNGMVLTLVGAGLLWFGWFGFNGGSAVGSNTIAGQAFAATQVAAAAAGLVWMLVEWLHRGKPTALGLASGVSSPPAWSRSPRHRASCMPGGALIIGMVAGAACYGMVFLKGKLGYDDTLDAFGIHGVGGLIGALLTAPLCFAVLDGDKTLGEQFGIQLTAVIFAVVFAFVGSGLLVMLVQAITLGNFRTSTKHEMHGLDTTEHGESGFDFSFSTSSIGTVGFDPGHRTGCNRSRNASNSVSKV